MENLCFIQMQVFAQFGNHRWIHQSGKFHLDWTQPFSGTEQFLHGSPIIGFIFNVFFFCINVCTPNDSNQRFALDDMARENIRCKVQDEFFRQNKAVFLIRQGNIFRKYRTAARNDSDFFAVFFLQYNNRIDFLVLQEWEWLLFADNLRREQRFDFRAEIRL